MGAFQRTFKSAIRRGALSLMPALALDVLSYLRR